MMIKLSNLKRRLMNCLVITIGHAVYTLNVSHGSTPIYANYDLKHIGYELRCSTFGTGTKSGTAVECSRVTAVPRALAKT